MKPILAAGPGLTSRSREVYSGVLNALFGNWVHTRILILKT